MKKKCDKNFPSDQSSPFPWYLNFIWFLNIKTVQVVKIVNQASKYFWMHWTMLKEQMCLWFMLSIAHPHTYHALISLGLAGKLATKTHSHINDGSAWYYWLSLCQHGQQGGRLSTNSTVRFWYYKDSWKVVFEDHTRTDICCCFLLQRYKDFLGPISERVYKDHDPKFVELCIIFSWKVMIRSGDNFAHVMTAELSWHMQNCDLTA